MPVAFIHHDACPRHHVAAHHPERPERLSAIDDRLRASGMDALLRHYQAPRVTRAQLERVHDAAYVEWVEASAPGAGGMVCLDQGDTVMSEHSLEAARRAAGAVVLGVDLVMAGEAHAAFCSVRPPGHHAEAARAGGFCIFNNVAVGAAHALAEHGLQRVAVVDFDVHHGNGTEAIFRNEPRVLFCSSFQHPFYPYTGADTVSEHIINVPLAAGTGGAAFRAAVAEHWFPALEAFAPELLLISAGFDAHLEDPLADFRLVEEDYAWITRELRALAERHAEGRMVSTLEGGYDLSALGRSVNAHLEALAG